MGDEQSGWHLRITFVTVITRNVPQDIPALWEVFSEKLCDNLPHKLQDQAAAIGDFEHPEQDYGLYFIRENVLTAGFEQDGIGLPIPEFDWRKIIGNLLIQRTLKYDHGDETIYFFDKYELLNVKQKHAFDTIVYALENSRAIPRFFFHGPAGTGKTFL